MRGAEDPGASSEPCCQVDTRVDRSSGPRLVSGTLGAALLGSACCTLPLLLAAAGVGLTSGGVGFLRRAPLFGLGLMALVIYLDVRRRNDDAFSLDALRRSRGRVLAALASFAIAWGAMTYVATPLLGRAMTASAGGTGPGAGASFTVPAGQQRLDLRIEGMYCPACVYTVSSRLSGLPGVSKVDVWLGGAAIAYDPSVIEAEEIRDAATFSVYTARIVGGSG